MVVSKFDRVKGTPCRRCCRPHDGPSLPANMQAQAQRHIWWKFLQNSLVRSHGELPTPPRPPGPAGCVRRSSATCAATPAPASPRTRSTRCSTCGCRVG